MRWNVSHKRVIFTSGSTKVQYTPKWNLGYRLGFFWLVTGIRPIFRFGGDA